MGMAVGRRKRLQRLGVNAPSKADPVAQHVATGSYCFCMCFICINCEDNSLSI